MAIDEQTVDLAVVIERAPGMNDDDLDRLTRHVLTEVRELDLDLAELATGGSAPEGTKSGTLAKLGALLIKVGPIVLPKLLELLTRIMSRQGPVLKITVENGDRKVSVEFTPSSTSNEQLGKVLDLLQERVGLEKKIILHA